MDFIFVRVHLYALECMISKGGSSGLVFAFSPEPEVVLGEQQTAIIS